MIELGEPEEISLIAKRLGKEARRQLRLKQKKALKKARAEVYVETLGIGKYAILCTVKCETCGKSKDCRFLSAYKCFEKLIKKAADKAKG